MNNVYIWEATTLKNISKLGVIESRSRGSAIKTLREQSFFRISLTTVPDKQLNSAMPIKGIIDILNSLTLMLGSGISIIETLELLINDRKSIVTQYVFCKLRDALHQGKSLELGFQELSPLFSDFFQSMISLCEKTGKLQDGLQALETFHQNQQNRQQEFQKLIRYPKVIFSITILLSLGVIVFIVPMFKNIYALFKGDLPILTRGMVFLSNFFQQYGMIILLLIACFFFWANLPKVRRFHPWVFVSGQVKKRFQGKEDPFLYAHAMKILLESGQPIQLATKQAAGCMSAKNQRHGFSLSKMLNAGLSFSEAFQELAWFPSIFHNYIASAEKAGLLKVGFEQVYNFLNRQREEQFAKWSRFIEPVLMLVLGTIVLAILLSIYLPIFDLGNQLG